MRMVHESGDVMELTFPDAIGQSSLLFNGRVIEHVLFSDENGGSVTTGDGSIFKPGREFAAYVRMRLQRLQGKALD